MDSGLDNKNLKKINKVLKSNGFHFILIGYGITTQINEIKEKIGNDFPDKKALSLKTKDSHYDEIINQIYAHNSGIVYIDDFENLLENKELCLGFNQRRDKLAKHEISLVCFYHNSQEEQIFNQSYNNIPDLWEFRSLIVKFEKEQNFNISSVEYLFPEVNDLKKESNFQINLLKENLEKLDKRNPEDINLIINYSLQLAKLLLEAGRYQETLNYALTMIEVKRETTPENDYYLATMYNVVSMIYFRWGKFDKALTYSKIEIEMIEKISEGDDWNLATTYSNVSEIYRRLQKIPEALEFIKKALKFREELSNNKITSLGKIYNVASLIYKDLGKFELALDYAQNSLKIRLEDSTTNRNSLAIAYNNIGAIYIDLGNYFKALEFLEKSLSLRKEVLGDMHPSLANSYSNIAVNYFHIKEINKSIDYFEKAIIIMEENFPDGHPDLNSMKKSLSIARKAKLNQ